jgi:hypothetical protein
MYVHQPSARSIQQRNMRVLLATAAGANSCFQVVAGLQLAVTRAYMWAYAVTVRTSALGRYQVGCGVGFLLPATCQVTT